MLKSTKRTQQEIDTYMEDLKHWLAEGKDATAEEMSAFFQKRLAEYEAVHLEHWAEEYAHIGDYFEDGLGSLLDIGCGTGLELASIYQRFPGAKVTGIDLSGAMLGRLRQTYAGKPIKLSQADYFEYPFEKNHYDAALSFETLHHFPYAKKQRIYEKLYHAVKGGGYYLECDYTACCEEEEAICLEFYEYRRRKQLIPEDVFVHIDIPLTMGHQLELMKNAGFRSVSVLYENAGTVIFKAVK